MRKHGWAAAITAATTATLLGARSLHAGNITWVGNVSTAWLDNNNWAGLLAPAPTDTAVFPLFKPSATVGIDMAGATNNGAANQAVGSIFFPSTNYAIFTIGNSA